MKLRKIAAWVIIVVIFCWIGYTLYRNWHKIPFNELHFNYPFLLLSLLSHATAYLVANYVWKMNLSMLGHSISFRNSIEIMSLTRLGRYIPGKVWFAMGRVWFAKKKGIPQRAALVTIVLEVALQFWAALFIFFASGAPSFSDYVKINPIFLVLILIIGLVFIHPMVFQKVVNGVLRIIKKQGVIFTTTYLKMLILLLMFILVFTLHGMGFFFLVRSFYAMTMSDAAAVVGSFGLAWIIGFLSFITPAGLGVREGALSVLLRSHLPAGINIIASLLSRLWLTVVDVLFFLLFVKYLRRYVE